MVFIRAFFRGLVLLIILLAVAGWTFAATLQSTLFHRETVKSWVEKSGAYENVVKTIEIRQVDATGKVDDAMLREAIGATFPPAYIQEQTEVAIDAAYNWLKGDASGISYSIPIHEKRNDFVNNLATLLETKLQNVPQCSSSFDISVECIPRTYTLETYAASIAKQTADDSDLFEEPITSGDMQPAGAISSLPVLARMTATMMWLLPLVIILGGVAYVALSHERLKAVATIGTRLVFGSFLLVVIGVLGWAFGGSLDLASRLFGGSDTTLVAMLVEPVMQQAVVSVGMWLTMWSGSVILFGIILWVVGYILQRRAGSRRSLASSSLGE